MLGSMEYTLLSKCMHALLSECAINDLFEWQRSMRCPEVDLVPSESDPNTEYVERKLYDTYRPVISDGFIA